MIGIASQTERMSRITRSSSFQDTGRFLVQAQRRHGTEVLTSNRDSGISQKIRWYNNSKKQDTLFSQTSVLWIEEFWNEDKRKVPFTSTENPRTRNSCFTRCILQLSSVSTEQRRTGVLSSTWRLKRKDQMQFLWTVKCWLLWSQKNLNGSPHTQARGNREQGHSSFRVLENRVQMTQLCERLPSSIWFMMENTTRYNSIENMEGEKSHFYVVNTQFHELSKNPKSGLLSLQEHWLDQLVKFILWQLLASIV